ncbi:MAG TPA: chlorite dismutase, partial [Acidobacteriaceae bacterium]
MAEAVAAPQEVESAAGARSATTDWKQVKRQVIGFTLYKVLPEWRRLPAEERAEHKRLFAETLKRWNQPGRMLSLSYSTV